MLLLTRSSKMIASEYDFKCLEGRQVFTVRPRSTVDGDRRLRADLTKNSGHGGEQARWRGLLIYEVPWTMIFEVTRARNKVNSFPTAPSQPFESWRYIQYTDFNIKGSIGLLSWTIPRNLHPKWEWTGQEGVDKRKRIIKRGGILQKRRLFPCVVYASEASLPRTGASRLSRYEERYRDPSWLMRHEHQADHPENCLLVMSPRSRVTLPSFFQPEQGLAKSLFNFSMISALCLVNKACCFSLGNLKMASSNSHSLTPWIATLWIDSPNLERKSHPSAWSRCPSNPYLRHQKQRWGLWSCMSLLRYHGWQRGNHQRAWIGDWEE